jgi:hypothetical protein
MAKEKGWVTAAEFNARAAADPEFQRKRAERKARHAALWAEMEPEHAAIRRDLAAVGLKVSSIDEVINMSAPYPKAIPVLVQHLATARHPVLRDALARALTVREAEGIASGPILRELKREPNPGSETRWAMANALTIVAVPADADEIAALVEDPNFEDVRERLTQALKNLRRPRRRRRANVDPAASRG